MAEQEHCAGCGHRLSCLGMPLVRMGGYLYHALCYVMREAPSAKAPIQPCGVN